MVKIAEVAESPRTG